MIKRILYIIIILLIGFSLRGTHLVATDLQYKDLGGGFYRIELRIYRDCDGISIQQNDPTVDISYYCGCSGKCTSRVLLPFISSQEVSQICSGQLTKCQSNTAPYEGLEESIYIDTLYLCAGGSGFTFEYNVASRPDMNVYDNVKNIPGPGSLNNCYNKADQKVIGNNSVFFNELPTVYACQGEIINYSIGGVDPDGDSLHYEISHTYAGPTDLIPFTAGYSVLYPFNYSITPFQGGLLNGETGQLSFIPNAIGTFLLTIKVYEYDKVTGALKGTVLRDIMIEVINCSNTLELSGINYSNYYEITTCYDEEVCFNVFSVSDPDSVVILTYNGGLPGNPAIFNTWISNDTTYASICWDPGTNTGFYDFSISALANVCPSILRTSNNYRIVIDSTLPVNPVCVDTTIYIGSSGIKNIDSSYVIDPFASFICGVDSIVLSKDVFDCSNVGITETIDIETYTNGDTLKCSSNITIVDTLSPTITCMDTTIYLNNLGYIIIDTSFIVNSVYDNCGIDTVYISKDSFSCAEKDTNIVQITVEDIHGNSAVCFANVIILDSLKPIASCMDTTIYIDGSGFAIIDSSFVNDSSYKSCGLIDSMSLSKYSFNCTEVGLNVVKLVVYDTSGNADSCQANITVLDTNLVEAKCKDTVVYLDASGYVSIDSSFINNGSTPPCSLDSITLNIETFDCSNLGVNQVKMMVYAIGNKIDSCTANVTVMDTIVPTVNCNDVVVYLNANGYLLIDTSDVVASYYDNCGVDTVFISKDSFACSNLDSNLIDVTVIDNSGNITICNAYVIVEDTLKPVANCKDTTIYLDITGNYTIDSSYINDSSFKYCGEIVSISLSKYTFDCSDIGTQSITMTVIDSNGRTNTCSSNITVLDTNGNLADAICKDTTVYLDASGQITIDSSFIDNGSFATCGVNYMNISKHYFDCSDTGINAVKLIVNFNGGIVDSCTANVTVIDSLAPLANCVSNLNVYLNQSGTAVISVNDINNGSSDNCAIKSTDISRTTFNCHDTGVHIVKLFVEDYAGNIDSCQTTVHIIDTISPTALCRDTVLFLNSLGQFIIDSSFINNGSNKPCVGISTMQLSQSTFDCTYLGNNNVVLTVRGNHGLVSSCTSTVTVIDSIAPTAICKDTTVYLDSMGNVSIHPSSIEFNSTDNCGVISVSANKQDFNCADTGLNSVSIYIEDASGNKDTCSANVTVIDTLIYPIYAGVDSNLCGIYQLNLYAQQPPSNLMGTWSLISGPNSPNINNINNPTTFVNGLVFGVYMFEWTVSSPLSCKEIKDTLTINVYDAPVSTAGNDQSLCYKDSTFLDGNNVLAPFVGRWVLLPGAPNTPIISNPNLYNTKIKNLIPGTYRLEWRVSAGPCDNDALDTVEIVVNNTLISNAGSDQSLCNTYSTTLTGNVAVAGVWTLDASAQNPGSPIITSPNSNTTSITGLLEGNYRFVWTIFNGVCSPSKDTISVFVYNQPTSNAGKDTVLCDLFSINLYGNHPQGTATGQWTLNPAIVAPSTPVFNNDNLHNTRVDSLKEGHYEFIWTVTNGTCTDAKDTMFIDIWNKPVVEAGIDTNLCGVYSLNLYATSTPYNGNWYLDPTAPNPNIPTVNNATAHNTNVSNLVEGIYTFVWRVINGPCFDITDTIKVSVYDPVNSVVGMDQAFCYRPSTIIEASTPKGTATGMWHLISSLPNVPVFDATKDTTVLDSLKQAGKYELYWEMQNGNCPVSRDTIVIESFAIPTADFSVDTNEICLGECLEFTNLSTINSRDNIVNYTWRYGFDENYNENPILCFDAIGSYDVRLIAESSNGCYDTVERNDYITVYEKPLANFDYFLVDDPNSSTIISVVDKSYGAINWDYETGDGLDYTFQNFVHEYQDSGFYDIKQVVTNQYGCSDSMTKTAFIHILLSYVPNTFTPNGDGLNETFLPNLGGDDPLAYKFQIFNRWGKLIFETDNKDKAWDGTFKGEPLQQGTYSWRLQTKFKDANVYKDFSGHINLVR